MQLSSLLIHRQEMLRGSWLLMSIAASRRVHFGWLVGCGWANKEAFEWQPQETCHMPSAKAILWRAALRCGSLSLPALSTAAHGSMFYRDDDE